MAKTLRFQEFVRPCDAEDLLSLTFHRDEFHRRLDAVRASIQSASLDALVCTFPPSICYISGYETLASFAPMYLIVPAERDPTLIVDEFESFNVLVSSWVKDVVTFPWAGDPTKALVDVLHHRGWATSRLGWEHHHHGGPYKSFMEVREATGAQWNYVRGLVDKVRAIKSAPEIAALREAASITSHGFDAVPDKLHPGVTDNAVAASVYQALVDSGSERMSIQPIVTAGHNSGIPHTTFGRSKLIPGYPVLLEWGACVKRYTAPMIRTGVVGSLADPVWQSMYKACQEAVNRTIAGMRPGASTLDLAREASEPLSDLPSSVFTDGNRGYSVGLGFEPDWADVPGLQIATPDPKWRDPISLTTYPTLRPGHAFHVRAVARDVGRAGVGISETVAVTSGGCEVLTKYNHDLIGLT